MRATGGTERKVTLQQLRYAVEVAERGSITAAAARLYIAQPSLSNAIAELEREMGIAIFDRSPQGVTLTEEGDRFLAYARQVVEQADLLEAHYVGPIGARGSLCVSGPHDEVLARALSLTAASLDMDRYEVALREVPSAVVVEDVRQMRSELGIVFRSESNGDALDAACRNAGLHFAPFARANAYALVGPSNPLAARDEVASKDLGAFPRVVLEWVSYTRAGIGRPLVALAPSLRKVRTTDRETQRMLVRDLGGFMLVVSMGVGSSTDGDLVPVPIVDAGIIQAGILTRPGFPLSPLALRFCECLRTLVEPADGREE